MQPLSLFGPVDAVFEPIIGYVVLALLLVNMATRLYTHRKTVKEARDAEAEDISRPLIHVATNLLLMLASFYYLSFHHHAGIVLTSLVVGVVLTDYFEFDAALVQIREGRDVEAPKASIGAAFVAFLYIAYLTLFTYIKPLWDAVI